MSNRLKKHTKSSGEETTNPFFFALSMLVEVYLALIICVYPFLIKAGYTETSHIKYNFLIGLSYGFRIGIIPVPAFVPLAALLAAAGVFRQLRDAGSSVAAYLKGVKWSFTDKMVWLYAASLILSTVVSSYKQELWWGYPGWNMGLASQFLFVFLYFVMSRFFDPDDLRFFVPACMAASGAVFLIAILQRYGFDVFQLYQGLEQEQRILFLSTIGQASWFSSYMILFVTMGIFIVWYADKQSILYKAGVVYLIIAGICLVTQNTDSAYAGLFLSLSLLFAWSFEDTAQMKRFLETALIILCSFRAAGIGRMMLKDSAIALESLSVFMTEHVSGWLLIGILVLAYVALCRIQKKPNKWDEGTYKVLGKRYAILLALAVVALFLYIVLNTCGLLPEGLSSTNNYLFFGRRWGNGRGAALNDTVLSYVSIWKENPLKGLFGAGADQFYHVIQEHVSEWTTANSAKVLTNAHNEWLTVFLNFGLFGGVVYILIFVSAIVRCAQNRARAPLAMCCAACVIAYMAHNLFCYQQYICTPYIFIIMGVGECFLRE